MSAGVVHVREPYDVYIGRRARVHGRWVGPSKWANPFRIGRDGSRDEVIRTYWAWLETQPQLLASLAELRDKTLGCWCKPEACHGDVLVKLAAARSAT